MGSYPYWHCKGLDDQLPYPHYSDSTWDKERTVYGALDAAHDDGAYPDRMQGWNYDKYDQAWAAVTAANHTPRAVQEFISNYYDRPVELTAIVYQTNRRSGYNDSYYAWRWIAESATDQT